MYLINLAHKQFCNGQLNTKKLSKRHLQNNNIGLTYNIKLILKVWNKNIIKQLKIKLVKILKKIKPQFFYIKYLSKKKK